MPAVRVIGALQGVEVSCRDKSGIFEGSIIRCKCCNKEYAPSAFEHHSGSSFRRPWKSIKDVNGKSIQEYREEQERLQETENVKTTQNEEVFVVEKIVSSRVRQGKKEYLVKWENYDNSHNSWIPPENFGDQQLLAEYEVQNNPEKKRKQEDVEKTSSRKSFRRTSDVSPHKTTSPEGLENDSPYSPPNSTNNSEWNSSPPHPIAEFTPLEKELLVEPFTDEMNEGGSPLLDIDDYLNFSEPSDSEDEEDIKPVTTITVDYEGMKGIFIDVGTYQELLEKALEYWEMNYLTSPKDWDLTNNKGAPWPMYEDISQRSPEVVYLKRKPGWK